MNLQNQTSVGIVIVNYKSEAELEATLSSMQALDYLNYRILIVDNSNSLESKNKLRKLEEKFNISVIYSPENNGFAAACNIGIANLKKQACDYIWLVNPDIVVSPTALSALLKRVMKNNNKELLGSKVLFGSLNLNQALLDIKDKEGKFKIWGAGGKVDFSRLQIDMIGHGEEDSGQHDVERECDYLPGCSLFFHAEIINQIGYLPEEYFMYFEETAWCVLAKKSGLKLIYVPSSVVWHCFDVDKLQSKNTIYYYNRNNLYLWSKYTNLKLKLKFSVLFKRLPHTIMSCLKEKQKERRKLFFYQALAYLDFFIGRIGRRD